MRVVAVNAVSGALARLAESLLAFGPTTAFSIEEDVVWVDTTGVAHLHGGEEALVREVISRVRALGHVCKAAIADGPRVASAVARLSRREASVVPEGENQEAMRVLPLSGLGLTAESEAWLRNVGMRTVGDLQRLPRASLGTRLGSESAKVMALAFGDDRAPLDAYRLPEIPEERVDLEYGAESVEALLFVAKTLCDRLGPRLEGRGTSATRLELVLSLDRACLPLDLGAVEAEKGRRSLSLSLPSPIHRKEELFAVLRARIENGYALDAPLLAATLRVPTMIARGGRTLRSLPGGGQSRARAPSPLGRAHFGARRRPRGDAFNPGHLADGGSLAPLAALVEPLYLHAHGFSRWPRRAVTLARARDD